MSEPDPRRLKQSRVETSMLDNRLSSAAERGDTDEVLALISEVPEEYRAGEFYLALLWATSGEKLDTMRALIAHGADVNAAHYRGHRILANAAKKGRIDAVRLLLEYGADVSARDTWGKTAMDYARKYKRTAVMALLQEALNAEISPDLSME